jgi:hypothetical protein
VKYEVCARCDYWRWDRNGPNYREKNEDTMFEFTAGECRRRAPQVTDVATFSRGAVLLRVWPKTGGDESCGEFEADAQMRAECPAR